MNDALLSVGFVDGCHWCTEAVLQSLMGLAGVRRGFKTSDERFHNFRAKDPDRPFCKTYLDPKPTQLKRWFASLLKTSEDST